MLFLTYTAVDMLEHRIKGIISRELGVELNRLSNEADIAQDLGADSLDTVQLVMVLEEEFGLEIGDDDAQGLRTVGDVIRYIEARS